MLRPSYPNMRDSVLPSRKNTVVGMTLTVSFSTKKGALAASMARNWVDGSSCAACRTCFSITSHRSWNSLWVNTHTAILVPVTEGRNSSCVISRHSPAVLDAASLRLRSVASLAARIRARSSSQSSSSSSSAAGGSASVGARAASGALPDALAAAAPAPAEKSTPKRSSFAASSISLASALRRMASSASSSARLASCVALSFSISSPSLRLPSSIPSTPSTPPPPFIMAAGARCAGGSNRCSA